MGWVGVSYDGVHGLIVVVRVRICSTIIPRGIWGRIRVWHRKARHNVRVPLPKYVGHSFLWYPKSMSRILDGGSVVKVVHQLGRGVRH
jgi:hypothetical protein